MRLHHFIRASTGFNIPTRAVCEHHQAPFDFVADSFYGHALNSAAWASRGSGKTIADAALLFCELLFKEQYSAVHFGCTSGQSQQAWRYLRTFLYSHPAILAQVDGKPLASRVTMRNGNTASVHPLTMNQASSPHVTTLQIDELDRVADRTAYQQALSIPMSSSSQPATTRLTSTHDQVGGLMGRIIEEAVEQSRTLFSWCVLDVIQTCGDEIPL